ncbi:MAG: GNAT family N-acetyltransferase [Acidimicrobiia bacterium]
MGDVAAVEVVEIPAEATHDLRRAVLRGGRADADVDFPEDRVEGAFHLGGWTSDGELVGVATFSPRDTEHRPGRRAYQLRGMAVLESHQGAGVGRQLLDVAAARLREAGAEVLWANGRDTALGFYRRWGMDVVGDGFVNPAGIPHHVVIYDL